MPNPFVVAACAFKGGAGRSTAAVNVASALMLKGKQVLLLDADFGSPGLHEILRTLDMDPFFPVRVGTSGVDSWGLQHLLNDFKNASFTSDQAKAFLKDRVFTLRERIASAAAPKGFGATIRSCEGELVFVPSSPKPPAMPWLDDGQPEQGIAEFNKRLNALLQSLTDRIRPRLGFDFVVLDAPSGLARRSEPIHNIANCLLVFYRRSIQHSFGTASMAQTFVYRKLQAKWRSKSILCIPSCVEDVGRVITDFAIKGRFHAYEAEVDKAFELGNVPSAVRGDRDGRGIVIHDDQTLRVLERIVMNEEASPLRKDYDALAEYVIDCANRRRS